MIRRLGHRQGFLLVEALLTIVILAVCLTLIIQGMSACLRAAAFTGHDVRAAMFLNNQLFDLYFRQTPEVPLSRDTDCSPPAPQFFCRTDSREAGLDFVKDLNRFDLHAGWAAGRHDLSVTTYLWKGPTHG